MRRRRRPRRGRRKGRRQDESPAYQQQEAPKTPPRAQPSVLPEWNWRTFPVFFAFVAGIVVMGIVANTLLGLIFFGGLFGLAYGAAHILTRIWLARRRR